MFVEFFLIEICISLRFEELPAPSSVAFGATFPPGKVFSRYVFAGNGSKIATWCRTSSTASRSPFP
jgi:hypothetical protein